MERILNFFSLHWRLVLVGVGVACVLATLLFYNLGDLTPPQYTAAELTSQQQSSSVKTVLQNPVDAPYKALVWVGIKLGHHSVLVTRVAAALCAVVVAGLFYWIVSVEYSRRTAILSAIMLVSSSGFLHIGRYGSGLILQMASLVLIGSVLLYRKTRHETLAVYLMVIVLASCLYIPGMVWLELTGLLLLRSHALSALKKLNNPHRWLVLVYGAVLVLPLLWASVSEPSVMRTLSGLPSSVPTLPHVFKELLHLGSSVVYRGYWPADYWLHAAPLLTLAELGLLLAGLAVMVTRPMLRLHYFTVCMLVVLGILVALGGSVTIAALIPLMYLAIAAGTHYLLDQWLTIFPRNPVAKFVGVSLVSFVVAFSAFYHLRAYFVAWPQAPETRAVYVVKQPS